MDSMYLEDRALERKHLEDDLMRLVDNYMIVSEEYNKTFSRDSAFIKDLVAGGLRGILAIYEVYARDGHIYPSYALEKLNNVLPFIEENIKYFELKLKEEKEDI
ncbi:MAG: hypothetical protein J6T15_04895 [Bacilli bacterium]|nr:hypothetical protein [Bacilli bacterium]